MWCSCRLTVGTLTDDPAMIVASHGATLHRPSHREEIDMPAELPLSRVEAIDSQVGATLSRLARDLRRQRGGEALLPGRALVILGCLWAAPWLYLLVRALVRATGIIGSPPGLDTFWADVGGGIPCALIGIILVSRGRRRMRGDTPYVRRAAAEFDARFPEGAERDLALSSFWRQYKSSESQRRLREAMGESNSLSATRVFYQAQLKGSECSHERLRAIKRLQQIGDGHAGRTILSAAHDVDRNVRVAAATVFRGLLASERALVPQSLQDHCQQVLRDHSERVRNAERERAAKRQERERESQRVEEERKEERRRVEEERRRLLEQNPVALEVDGLLSRARTNVASLCELEAKLGSATVLREIPDFLLAELRAMPYIPRSKEHCKRVRSCAKLETWRRAGGLESCVVALEVDRLMSVAQRDPDRSLDCVGTLKTLLENESKLREIPNFLLQQLASMPDVTYMADDNDTPTLGGSWSIRASLDCDRVRVPARLELWRREGKLT